MGATYNGLCSKYNLFDKWIWLSVRDKWIPTEFQKYKNAVADVRDDIDAGRCVLVHCNGGKGRTGTFVCAYLITKGWAVDAAIQQVRYSRPGTIRNPLQILYLISFAQQCSSSESLLR